MIFLYLPWMAVTIIKNITWDAIYNDGKWWFVILSVRLAGCDITNCAAVISNTESTVPFWTIKSSPQELKTSLALSYKMSVVTFGVASISDEKAYRETLQSLRVPAFIMTPWHGNVFSTAVPLWAIVIIFAEPWCYIRKNFVPSLSTILTVILCRFIYVNAINSKYEPRSISSKSYWPTHFKAILFNLKRFHSSKYYWNADGLGRASMFNCKTWNNEVQANIKLLHT